VSYTKAFLELLENVASSRHAPAKLAAFWPICGDRYTGELLVIGRAVDSWYDSVAREELRSEGGRRAALDKTRRRSESDCMREFVDEWYTSQDKRPSRSGFWRTAQQTAERLGLGVGPASLHGICYTNLFKIAPETGNPARGFRRLQIEISVNLLRDEIAAFDPRRILVVSGQDWVDEFAKRLHLPMSCVIDDDVFAVVENRQQRWVLAKRPDRREKGLTEASWVEAVVKAFSS